MNIFEYAAKNKLRFDNPRGGSLQVEDLYSLPMEGNVSLNTVAINLHNRIKNTEVSFVSPVKADDSLTVSLEIVKHIIADKQATKAKKAEQASRAAERKVIREALARKKEEKLLSSDVSVLEARLAELGED